MLGRGDLTPRAAAFLTAGAVMVLAGLQVGWPPVTQIGIFLTALPLASWAIVMLRRDQVSASRQLPAKPPQLGDSINVVLAVAPRGGGLGPIMVSDSAPPILGGTHVAAISGTSRQHTSRHSYRLIAARRGTHLIGPAHMYLTDRLGLVARRRQIAGTAEVTVVPQVHPLLAGIPTGATSGPGWATAGAPGGSHDDVIPRDYRPGDELRRMDWPATARTGKLMVRGEEQPWRASLLVVLDRRERSHRGLPGADSFETALSMVASVGSMALTNGWDLRVVDLEAILVFASNQEMHPEHNIATLCGCLARLGPSKSDGLNSDLTSQLPQGSPALVVLGELATDEVARVAQLLTGAHPAMATVIAASSWDDNAPPGPGPQAEQAAEILRSNGWLANITTSVSPIPEVWRQLQAAARMRCATRAESGRQ